MARRKNGRAGRGGLASRRLQFENLESRVVLSGSSIVAPILSHASALIDEQPLAAQGQPLAAVADSQIATLPYWRFPELTPAQIPLLSLTQVASIPTVGWFAVLEPEARAAFTQPQVRSLRVDLVRIELLTPQQVSWLSLAQIQSVTFWDFRFLAPWQMPSLTSAQIASIPSAGVFGNIPAAARAALTLPQIQSLNVAAIPLDMLTPQQIGWLTVPQIRALNLYGFQHLSAAQTPYLTPAQLATIPDPGTFTQWSAAARAALTFDQVRALRVATVRIELLTPQQVSWLSLAQIQSVTFWDFRFLAPWQMPSLTSAQIASIPSAGVFGNIPAAARAALTLPQIQSLNVAAIPLDMLTPQQIGWLTVPQIRALNLYGFQHLSAAQTPYLTPAQLATIPDPGTFTQWSAAARAALTFDQVRALRVATVRIELLTPQQVSWLSLAQIQSVTFWDFRFLAPWQMPSLTSAQIASIPSAGVFGNIPAAARAALTLPQIQSLNVAAIPLDMLTPQQIGWLTVPQIRALNLYGFQHLSAAQTPYLTPAQLATIPDPGTFTQWSAAARAALTFDQVRALRVATVGLSLLSPQQIGWLSVAQIQSLKVFDFEKLLPSQISTLTLAQIGSLADNYNLRGKWSDEQMEALTQAQILAMPYVVYSDFISLATALRPPTTYVPVTQGGHHGLHAPNAEADQVFNLVPLQVATHVTIGSGNWSNPAIWRNGVVPGANARVVIATGTNVRFDEYLNTAIFTLRIDGTLKFATDVDTQLKVDTVVVTTHGALHIGTAAAPIADNVTARILIADNGPINTAWDPYLWSRGIVSRGELRVYGKTVTPFTTITNQPLAGATTITLGSIPVGWQVGDDLVIGGTNPYSDDFGADRVRIRAIHGTTITVDPLRYSHLTPEGQGLFLYVSNINRNVHFMAEDASIFLQRPHFAQIHNPDAIIENLGVYGFGRTDKNVPINSPVVINGVLKPGTGTNPRARYSIHFHHTGVNPAAAPAVIRGSVVVGSPGWGFVNHSSNVVMENNVSYLATGAGFVTEDGNEIGVMRGNLAMSSMGSGDQILARSDNHDFGHGGHGFWFQGPGVSVYNNVSIGSQGAAFAYITSSSKTLFDAVNLANPALAAGHAAVPINAVPLRPFDGNVSISARSGLEIWHHNTFMPDGQTIIANFTSWNNRFAGIDLHYVGNVVIYGAKLYGNDMFSGYGIATNRLTHGVIVVYPYITGFEVGIDVPVRRNSTIHGGNITAVQGLYIEKGYDTIRTATITGVNFMTPTFDQLRGRTYYPIYATAAYTFAYPAFLDRRVDSLLSQDVIRISFDGRTMGQLYYHEQLPNYVPFPAAKASNYVPAGWLDKTNLQLRSEFGFSFAGELMPASARIVPGIYGYMKYS